MLPPLSLHQITAIEAQPPQLVDIAAATGCKHVCAFVHVPAGRAADATESAASGCPGRLEEHQHAAGSAVAAVAAPCPEAAAPPGVSMS